MSDIEGKALRERVTELDSEGISIMKEQQTSPPPAVAEL